MSETPLSPVALRQRRELTIARLCDHFARDHLEAEELEQLIDRAHQATSLAELDRLLEGLPSPDAAPHQAQAPLAHDARQPEQQLVVAVMGGAERKGAWTPARNTYVTALMGGAGLDFRDAHLEPGVTEVYVLAIMGGVEIVVPPDIRVESNGIGIMGGFEHVGSGKFPVDSVAPVLRVTGLALMGGVEIKVRARGELPHDPRRRLPPVEPRDGSGWTQRRPR